MGLKNRNGHFAPKIFEFNALNFVLTVKIGSCVFWPTKFEFSLSNAARLRLGMAESTIILFGKDNCDRTANRPVRPDQQAYLDRMNGRKDI